MVGAAPLFATALIAIKHGYSVLTNGEGVFSPFGQEHPVASYQFLAPEIDGAVYDKSEPVAFVVRVLRYLGIGVADGEEKMGAGATLKVSWQLVLSEAQGQVVALQSTRALARPGSREVTILVLSTWAVLNALFTRSTQSAKVKVLGSTFSAMLSPLSCFVAVPDYIWLANDGTLAAVPHKPAGCTLRRYSRPNITASSPLPHITANSVTICRPTKTKPPSGVKAYGGRCRTAGVASPIDTGSRPSLDDKQKSDFRRKAVVRLKADVAAWWQLSADILLTILAMPPACEYDVIVTGTDVSY